jgi:glutathione S-transferase
MKLIYSAGSPFARKVRIILAEKGIDAELRTVDVYDGPELMAANPIGQVPALVLDGETSLFDSAVICAWLDGQPGGPRLIPDGDEQWPVRRNEAAADAVMENVIKLMIEGRRPEDRRWPERVATLTAKTRHALDALNAQGADQGFDLAEIALVVALDYIDFRLPQLAWREGRPNLVVRHQRLADRPSFVATRPL